MNIAAGIDPQLPPCRDAYPDEESRQRRGGGRSRRRCHDPRPEGWVRRETTIGRKGCIAVTNEQMDEIWTLVPEGTPILIHP